MTKPWNSSEFGPRCVFPFEYEGVAYSKCTNADFPVEPKDSCKITGDLKDSCKAAVCPQVIYPDGCLPSKLGTWSKSYDGNDQVSMTCCSEGDICVHRVDGDDEMCYPSHTSDSNSSTAPSEVSSGKDSLGWCAWDREFESGRWGHCTDSCPQEGIAPVYFLVAYFLSVYFLACLLPFHAILSREGLFVF